jgi:isocitrate/isopropylmalate dehydrogenase
MSTSSPITAAYGDGIGPEIMGACLHVIREAGARIEIEVIEIGEKVCLSGNSAGIEPSAWESLRRNKVFYKAHITTPQVAKSGTTPKQTVELLGRVLDQGIEIVKTETLRSFDGAAGYTLAQGQ